MKNQRTPFAAILYRSTPLALLTAAFIATGCATPQYDPVSGREVRNMYTLEEDIKLGRSVVGDVVEEMRKQNIPMNQDSAKLNTLSNMMHRIAAASHYPDLPYSVVLIHTNIVNAAAAPGGQLLFWEGLYDPDEGLVKNDTELAAVMAHEIAHATARHTTRTLTRTMPVSALFLAGALAAELTDNSDLAIALGAAFVLYEGVWLPRYSRQDEHEADRIGLFYMAEAGYDPRAAARLWRRVYERDGDPGLFKYLSSHPSHRDRYRALEQLMPDAMAVYAEATGGYPSDYTP